MEGTLIFLLMRHLAYRAPNPALYFILLFLVYSTFYTGIQLAASFLFRTSVTLSE